MKILRTLALTAPEERMAILMSVQDEVLAHCRSVLRECSDDWIVNERTLITRAFDAFESGQHEAAMALAVIVGERLALWASEPRVLAFGSSEERDVWERKVKKGSKYAKAQRELALVSSTETLSRLDVMRHALIAPIPHFFFPFYGEEGETIPETVSRHAAVHQPDVQHFSVENAILALMLCVSILRDEQSWCIEVRTEDAL